METIRTRRAAEGDRGKGPEEEEVFEVIEPQQPPPEIKQGFWQFEESAAWQSVANPYPIQ